MQGWLEDQGILVLSYIGAFLLIVATILFEVYGLRGLDGTIQFLAVLALNLLFGVLGYLCLSSERLRIVGRSYIGIFALMSPLVVVAAYVFLQLRERGISPGAGLLLGGLYCFVLYGGLAARLRSAAYGWLSLAALPFAALGAANTLGQDSWSGVALAAVVVGYLLLHVGGRGWPGWGPFALAAQVLPLVVAPLAILWSLGAATAEGVDGLSATGVVYPYLPLTFALLGAACALHSRLTRHWWLEWAVPAALSLTVVSGNFSLRDDQQSLGLCLLALGWAYALGARPAARFRLSDYMRAGAAVQLLPLLLNSFDSPALEAGVLLAATAAGVFLALQPRQPWWLLVAGALFVDAWYATVRAVVPPPPNPGPDTLALVLSPIPVVYAAAAMGLRGWVAPGARRAWAPPLFVLSGCVAAGVAVLAVSGRDLELFGWIAVVYSLVFYVIGISLNVSPVVAPAALGLATGIVVLLLQRRVDAWVYPVVISALSVLVYAIQDPWWRRQEAADWASFHRFSGLGLAALTVLVGFSVPALLHPHETGVLGAIVAILVLAGLVYSEGARGHGRHLDLVAVLIGSLVLTRAANYLGAENAQLYVAGPGLALLLVGRVLGARDRAQLALSQLAVGAGLALLMVTTLLQTGGRGADPVIYIALLLGESVAAIAIGISLRSRVFVVAGGIGAALAALRALFQVIQAVPLFVVFGGVALLVLVVAAVLALARESLRGMGSGARGAWSGWE
jgi:hypothetical protein